MIFPGAKVHTGNQTVRIISVVIIASDTSILIEAGESISRVQKCRNIGMRQKLS